MIAYRPYRDLADLQAILAVLSAGAAADSRVFYPHPGDLSWWLFYTDNPAPLEERVWLWEADGATIGWTVFTVSEGLFDLFVHPAWLGRPEYAEMHAASVAHLSERARAQGGSTVGAMWISVEDADRLRVLADQGFTACPGGRGMHLVRLSQSLESSLAPAELPEGCTVREGFGESDLEARARPQAAAFKTKLPWEQYLGRYRRFMGSPVYADAHDTGLQLPDGTYGAVTIWWVDPTNEVGHFEPVATHPDLHRRGYGRALLRACLRRMQHLGLKKATVCADADNVGNIAFYRACGFEVVDRLIDFERTLEPEH